MSLDLAHQVTARLDGADVIGNLLAHLVESHPIDPLTSEAIVIAILRAVRRGESLYEAFGLSAAGRRSLQRRLLTLQRDRHLIEAVSACALDESLSTWMRCKRLAPLIRQFVRAEWPRVRRLAQPLSDWPEWKHALFLAARSDIPLPQTPERLYQITKAMTPDSFQRKGAMLLSCYL